MMANHNAPLRDAVLAALKRSSLTSHQLAGRTGGKLKSVQKIMIDLRREGLVHVADEHTPRIYVLGPGEAAQPIPKKENEDQARLRRVAAKVKPFRDEFQAWMFGPAGGAKENLA